jgi:hypothetical protein
MVRNNDGTGSLKVKEYHVLQQSLNAVFRIRIYLDPHSIGRVDPDPGGLKRAKKKKKKRI